MKLKTSSGLPLNIDRKLLTSFVTAVIVGLIARLGVEFDEETSAAVATIVGFVAGYISPPSPTVPADLASLGDGD